MSDGFGRNELNLRVKNKAKYFRRVNKFRWDFSYEGGSEDGL
jgi:hypothetical protein